MTSCSMQEEQAALQSKTEVQRSDVVREPPGLTRVINHIAMPLFPAPREVQLGEIAA